MTRLRAFPNRGPGVWSLNPGLVDGRFRNLWADVLFTAPYVNGPGTMGITREFAGQTCIPTMYNGARFTGAGGRIQLFGYKLPESPPGGCLWTDELQAGSRCAFPASQMEKSGNELNLWNGDKEWTIFIAVNVRGVTNLLATNPGFMAVRSDGYGPIWFLYIPLATNKLKLQWFVPTFYPVGRWRQIAWSGFFSPTTDHLYGYHSIAITRKVGGTFEAFRDGVSFGTKSRSYYHVYNQQPFPLVIGAAGNSGLTGSNHNVFGQYLNTSIFNRVLAEDEIRALHEDPQGMYRLHRQLLQRPVVVPPGPESPVPCPLDWFDGQPAPDWAGAQQAPDWFDGQPAPDWAGAQQAPDWFDGQPAPDWAEAQQAPDWFDGQPAPDWAEAQQAPDWVGAASGDWFDGQPAPDWAGAASGEWFDPERCTH